MRSLFLPSVECEDSCNEFPDACAAARRVVENPAIRTTFARMVLSAVFDPAAVDRVFPDVYSLVDPMRPAWVDSARLRRACATHAARRFAARRGAQAGWYTRSPMSWARRFTAYSSRHPAPLIKSARSFRVWPNKPSAPVTAPILPAKKSGATPPGGVHADTVWPTSSPGTSSTKRGSKQPLPTPLPKTAADRTPGWYARTPPTTSSRTQATNGQQNGEMPPCRSAGA
jgi:hypothetical protein